jgi:hypothetical protein
MSKMFFNMPAVFDEFEADLSQDAHPRRHGHRPLPRQPKLTARRQTELVRMHATGEYVVAELVEVFSIGRATVHRALARSQHSGTSS